MKFFLHLVVGILFSLATYLFFVQSNIRGSDIETRKNALNKEKPDIVLIGNSLLKAGIDEKDLSTCLGLKCLKTTSNGSETAWWYLYTKNVLCLADEPPRYAIIFFRDHFLTEPCFRVDGEYAKPIRALCAKNEPHLAMILSKAQLDLWDSPLTSVPQEAKTRFEDRMLKIAGKWLFGIKSDQAHDKMREVFDENRMSQELLSQKQLSSEVCVNEQSYCFEERVQNSFLPEIITLLEEKKIQPIFVRVKRRRDTVSSAEPQALKGYIVQLKEYLETRHVQLVDFTSNDQILTSHFGAGDHLNSQGKQLFTDLLGEKIIAIDPKDETMAKISPSLTQRR